MKNFVKEGQKLPLYGIGPHLVVAMGAVTLIGILLSENVFKSGLLTGLGMTFMRIAGVILIALGIAVWFIGAVRSGMDESIADNKLKTDGIYAWVRNPMYSGWLMAFAGISLQWHNIWLLAAPLINWVIMTAVLKNTEEKWLKNLYGKEYENYCMSVNRCWLWFPRKG